MKYIIRCQAISGEIVNEFSLDAYDENDARIKSHSHPEYEKSMLKAHEQGICEYQFVIYPLTDMN